MFGISHHHRSIFHDRATSHLNYTGIPTKALLTNGFSGCTDNLHRLDPIEKDRSDEGKTRLAPIFVVDPG